MSTPEYPFMVVSNENIEIEPIEMVEVQQLSLRERLLKRDVMESTVLAIGIAASLGYIDHLFHGLS